MVIYILLYSGSFLKAEKGDQEMGKDLMGKELGVGINQRKDGLYTARFTDKSGKRRQQYFKKLQECRNWLADAQFEDEHGNINASSNMTVDAWFEYWISEVKGKTIRWTTAETYRNQYSASVKEVIGNMQICDVKPLHCQRVLNIASEKYAKSTEEHIRKMMVTMFGDAAENGLIRSNPVKKSVKCRRGCGAQAKVLTLEEHRKFLGEANESVYYRHFSFVLQTGVRESELRGLKWNDIDFVNRAVRVQRSLIYDSGKGKFIESPTKTESGVRDIPLTQEALEILSCIKQESRKIIPIEFSDYVFLNKHGKPVTNAGYSDCTSRICKRAGIKQVSMHTLRHTFATRCIESGMKPKTLQKIMGHSNISITMNLYVHITENEKEKEMKMFEKICKVI